MRSLSFLSIGPACFALTVALALPACGGSTEASIDDPAGTGNGGESDDALTAGSKVKVAAITFALPVPAQPGHFSHESNEVTIGASAKVAKVLKALKKRKASDPQPQCSFGPATRMTFYGTDGKKVGTGSYFCHRGTVDFDGLASIDITPNESAIHEAVDALYAPGDTLWAIDKVTVRRNSVTGSEAPTGPKVKTSKADIATLVEAMRPNEETDPSVTTLSCSGVYTLTFERAGSKVATVHFGCGSHAPTDPHAEGVIDPDGMAKGGLRVDGQAVTNVYLD
jgi:hypothetical protein